MDMALSTDLPAPDSGTRALYADSSLREKIVEYGFVGQLLRALWQQGRRDIEVLRAEVDRGGYDLVLHCSGVTRHVQLKSSHRNAATAKVTVNLKLAEKASGCVIWILFDRETLALGPFLWFGGSPGEPLGDLGTKIARHTKANSGGRKLERPGHRVVERRRFVALNSMAELIEALFGSLRKDTSG